MSRKDKEKAKAVPEEELEPAEAAEPEKETAEAPKAEPENPRKPFRGFRQRKGSNV